MKEAKVLHVVFNVKTLKEAKKIVKDNLDLIVHITQKHEDRFEVISHEKEEHCKYCD